MPPETLVEKFFPLEKKGPQKILLRKIFLEKMPLEKLLLKKPLPHPLPFLDTPQKTL